MSTVLFVYNRYHTLISQGLEDTYNRDGLLRYDYNVGHTRLGVQLGRFRKLSGLPNRDKNVELPRNTKRNFSTCRGSHNFKKLKKHNGKFINLIEVLSDVDFLQGAYQRIKSNPGVMAKGSDSETLDGLLKFQKGF